MGIGFADPLHDQFATSFGLGLTSHGGIAPGVLLAVRDRVGDGGDDAWYEAWMDAAEQCSRDGEHLRAALAYGLAYHPLFGAPIDPRLRAAWDRQWSEFAAAAAAVEPPGELVEIPYESTTIPGYFFRTPSDPDGPRPLLVATNGYDATIVEMFAAQGLPALRRGCHVLLVDGPGQGRTLIEQQLTIRGDWEHVVGPVLDVAVALDGVDADRIVLTGWSLGGYLALRAASSEHRLAACIADPGLYGVAEGMQARLRAMGVAPDVLARYPDLPAEALAPMEDFVRDDRMARWTVEQRGFWVHGVDTLAGYVEATADFSLAGRLGGVRCPTLVCAAEADPLSASADRVLDELGASATPARFTTAEGAGDHCEMGNRTRYDQVVFDWLAATVGDGRAWSRVAR